MPPLFVILAIAVVSAAVTERAQAQPANYPWCARYETGVGDHEDCTFLSFEQCNRSSAAWAVGARPIRATLLRACPPMHRPGEGGA